MRQYGIRSCIVAEKPQLNDREMDLSLEIATRNLARDQEDLNRVTFIDEFHFDTGAKAKIRVKRRRNTRFDPAHTNSCNMDKGESYQ